MNLFVVNLFVVNLFVVNLFALNLFALMVLDKVALSPTTIMGAVLFLSLAGAYLLFIPLLTYFYLKQRWYVASSFERAFMYFLVFFFFPGLLLLSPFLNFRPQIRTIE